MAVVDGVAEETIRSEHLGPRNAVHIDGDDAHLLDPGRLDLLRHLTAQVLLVGLGSLCH